MNTIYEVTNCNNTQGSQVGNQIFCTEDQLEGVKGTPIITNVNEHWGLLKVISGDLCTNMYAENFSEMEIDLMRERYDTNPNPKYKMWFATKAIRDHAVSYLTTIYH